MSRASKRVYSQDKTDSQEGPEFAYGKVPAPKSVDAGDEVRGERSPIRLRMKTVACIALSAR
jgi:hypothetical protein